MVEKWEAQKFLLIMQKAKFFCSFIYLFFFSPPEQFDLKLLQKLEKLQTTVLTFLTFLLDFSFSTISTLILTF